MQRIALSALVPIRWQLIGLVACVGAVGLLVGLGLLLCALALVAWVAG